MGRPKPEIQGILSVRRRKSIAKYPWVGLLARKDANRCFDSRPLHLPRLLAEWFIEATRLHSQWRDRAGFTPDFPVMPLVGTQGRTRS